MTRNSIIQRKVLGQAPPFAHGQLAYANRHPRVRGYRNLDGGAAQVETITIDTYSDGDTVTVELTDEQGEVYSYTYTMTTEDADGSGVASSLATILNKLPWLRRIGTSEASGATIVITGDYVGVDFTIAVSATGGAAISTTTTTTAALANAIAYGSVVLRDGQTAKNEPKAKQIDVSALTKRSAVFTHGESASAQLVIEFEGETYEASGATAAALETALDAALPTGLTASVASTAVTITVDTEGDVFEIVSIVGDIELTTWTKGDSLDDLIAGITCYSDMSVDNEGIAGERKVGVCEDGEVAHSVTGATIGNNAYVGTSGSEKGKVYASRAAGRVYSKRLRFTETHSNLAVVDVLRAA